ncbi:hypothetical protein EHO58_05525 [Leptospira selangorensis]|uniref:hypothetical protein n=1 Tax=Leptospira selangorensis TaxID=2484982 RepID=UPI001083C242|nr:hypothetical protein [Leptospira selangorensis]TGK08635.1 hypothetical protein EHO58_05525 [Leptospira selangorensis]
MYLNNILIALFVLISLVIVLTTIALILTFIKDYRDFDIDFSGGIFLKRMILSNLNMALSLGKVQEFESGIVKVVSETLFFVRRRLASETISGISRRTPLVYSKVEFQSNSWVAEIRISWVSLILLLYPLLFFGYISITFTFALLNVHVLFSLILCVPFAIVYFLYLIIENEAIYTMEGIFKEFSAIVSQ